MEGVINQTHGHYTEAVALCETRTRDKRRPDGAPNLESSWQAATAPLNAVMRGCGSPAHDARAKVGTLGRLLKAFARSRQTPA